MSCARLEEVLVAVPADDAIAHAKGCADCGPARSAWEAMGGLPAAPEGLERLAGPARAELARRPGASRWWLDAVVLLGVNLGVAAAGLAVLSVRPSAGSWGLGAALLALLVAGLWAAVRPGGRVFRLVVLALGALTAVWAGLGGTGGGSAPAAIGCALTECGLSVVPLAAALWITSRFSFHWARALVAGLSVGAGGMLVLHLHCPSGAPAHLVLFHLLPWLAVALLAVALRRMVPSRSFAP